MNIIDCLYTDYALYLGGEEANPFVQYIIVNYGGIMGVLAFKGSMLALLGLALPFMHLEHHRNVRWFFYFAVAAYTVLTAYHVIWYYWKL